MAEVSQVFTRVRFMRQVYKHYIRVLHIRIFTTYRYVCTSHISIPFPHLMCAHIKRT